MYRTGQGSVSGSVSWCHEDMQIKGYILCRMSHWNNNLHQWRQQETIRTILDRTRDMGDNVAAPNEWLTACSPISYLIERDIKEGRAWSPASNRRHSVWQYGRLRPIKWLVVAHWLWLERMPLWMWMWSEYQFQIFVGFPESGSNFNDNKCSDNPPGILGMGDKTQMPFTVVGGFKEI